MLANLAKNLQKRVPRLHCSEQRHTPIATARDELPVTEAITPPEFVSHKRSQNPQVFNPKTCGTLLLE
jgi:hypothetical protein